MEHRRRAIIYTDGASRGNPGKSGCGAVIIFDNGKVELKKYIGIATNNQAEYNALIIALEYLSKYKEIKNIEIYTDSQLMARQLNGEYKVKNKNIFNLYKKVIDLLHKYTWQIESIPREENKEADRLANEAIDKNIK